MAARREELAIAAQPIAMKSAVESSALKTPTNPTKIQYPIIKYRETCY